MDFGLYQEQGAKVNLVPRIERGDSEGESGKTCLELWKDCLNLLQEELPQQTIQTWFKPITPVSFLENVLVLRVPNRFTYHWLDTHYDDMLQATVEKVFGNSTQIEFLIATLPGEEEWFKHGEAIPETAETQTIPEQKTLPRACDLNHRYTFANFYSGIENELAKKAALTVAENIHEPGYNPLIIYGGIGTGKSHLLHAIGNYVATHFPSSKIKVVECATFVNDYITALQGNRLNQYMAELTGYDLLLFDDIHLLGGKMKTQEGFLVAVSHLTRRKKQVVITSNIAPGAMEHFNPRLVAFMQSGLIVDLVPSETDTRGEMIRQYFLQNDLQPDEKIVQLLSGSTIRNLHDLQSILVRIIAQVSLLKRSLTYDDVRYIMSRMCPQAHIGESLVPAFKQIGIDDVVKVCSDYFKIPIDILTGVSRKKRVLKSRHITLYLCRELTYESLNTIGYHFSNLNHATVLYAHKKVQALLQTDPLTRSAIQAIKALLLR